MAKIMIYLPDKLYDRLKEHPDLNYSQICRMALQKRLRMNDAKSRMERVRIHMDEAMRELEYIGVESL